MGGQAMIGNYLTQREIIGPLQAHHKLNLGTMSINMLWWTNLVTIGNRQKIVLSS